jgi:hypothetical protein
VIASTSRKHAASKSLLGKSNAFSLMGKRKAQSAQNHLFKDDNFISSLGVPDVLARSNFDDILDEAVAIEEDEMLLRTSVQPDVAMVDSDEEGEKVEGALEDEGVDWEAEAM